MHMSVREVQSNQVDRFVSPTTPTEFAKSLEPSVLEIVSDAVKTRVTRPFRAAKARVVEASRSEAKVPQKLFVAGAFLGTTALATYFGFQPEAPEKPETPPVAESTPPVTVNPLVKECLQQTVHVFLAEEDFVGAQVQINACKQDPLGTMGVFEQQAASQPQS